MEALLSLAFDNLTSYDAGKVRKGLRQVDGLLAQICLARGVPGAGAAAAAGAAGAAGAAAGGNKMSAAEKRRSAMLIGSAAPPPSTASKPLASLKEDPAFREFFKLQDGFEWNGMFSLFFFLLLCVCVCLCVSVCLLGGKRGREREEVGTC